jgi:hypothetical protein
MVQFIRYCLADSEFQEHELEDIQHLKRLLGMNDAQFEEAYQCVTREVYARNTKEVMADNVVTEEEKARLAALREHLKVSPEFAEQIFRRQANANMAVKLDEITRDNRLTPDEEKELQSLAGSLGVQIKLGASTAAALEQMRRLWLIENQPLPAIPAPPGITLNPGETAYFQVVKVDYAQMRDMSRATGQSHSTVRMKITRFVYFPSDNPLPYNWTEEQQVARAEGTLVLTDKRIMFRSPRLQVDCPIPDIVDFNLYKNGIVLDLQARPTMFFGFTENQVIFSATLARLLRKW